MKKAVLILFALLLFVGCSFKSEPNVWEYNSAKAFQSYKENFLKGNDLLAASDLKRAVALAKSSDDLTQLASIYLGKCALEIAVGKQSECRAYKQIHDLVTCKKIRNYYLFLQNDTENLDVVFLPKRYQEFASALKKRDYKSANEEIRKIEDPASAMIALSLLGTQATKESLETTLKKVSFYGYKKGVIHLLEEILKKTDDINEKKILQKKIDILKH